MAKDDDKKQDLLLELYKEKEKLESSFHHSIRLLSKEIARVECEDEVNDNGSVNKVKQESSLTSIRLYDPYSSGVIKLSERVLIPVKNYPGFNFIGKLLGPRGNTLKRLQSDTLTKMSILGKGSIRDSKKEEELRRDDPCSHLHLELHVLVEVEAPFREAHQRLCTAVEALTKFLRPTNSDSLHQQQMIELAYLSGKQDESGRLASVNKSQPRHTIHLKPANITAVNERRISNNSHSSRVKNLITSRSASLARQQESMPSTYVEYSRERYEPHFEESYSHYTSNHTEASNQSPRYVYSYDTPSESHRDSVVDELDGYDEDWRSPQMKIYTDRSKSYRRNIQPY